MGEQVDDEVMGRVDRHAVDEFDLPVGEVAVWKGGLMGQLDFS